MITNKQWEDKYIKLNAMSKVGLASGGGIDYSTDKQAANLYVEHHVKPNMKEFHSISERYSFLVKHDYYEEEIVAMYKIDQIEELHAIAKSHGHSFPSFMGALKFFNVYGLKSFDNKEYLETYEDRVIMNALFLGGGCIDKAKAILHSIITGRFQPATPTFLNAGKKQRGEYVSCYLLRVEDNMESIGRGITSSLQLSKRGGGVALCLTNIREFGSPIKKIEGQSTGIVPVMKLLEDSFSYANQLGQRQGAGAVYLNAHHPDIMTFLDTKRENADEKIRIKSLSLGIVVPDVTFQLAKEDKDMALFSPYDVERVYGKPFSDISVTKEYDNMVKDNRIKKTYISARKLFHTIAKLHFESGYPYLMFDDTINHNLPHPGRIVMSNLCSEIAQVSTLSEYNSDQSYSKIGQDICCNLGSLNIASMMEAGEEFGPSVQDAIRSLDHVSRHSDFSPVPSIELGNQTNNAIGLGAMNLHGFLSTNEIMYASKEAVDFTNMFFYTMAYHSFKASHVLAVENGKPFTGFEHTKFADGTYFAKYTECADQHWTPATDKITKIFDQYNVVIPTKQDWIDLVEMIKKDGIANAYLMAVAPTGSISYLSSCTPSLQPVVEPVETRKEGKLGRVYFPAYKLDDKSLPYYKQDAYEVGPEAIIDIVAAAQQHVDQAISLTLFMKDTATTRDLNKAYIYAFKKKCKTIYYVRVRQEVIEGSETYNDDLDNCTACAI